MTLYIAGNVADQNGVPVVGAQVYIFAGGVLATIEDASGSPLANPVTTVADGFYEARSASNGFHVLEIYWGEKLRYKRELGEASFASIVNTAEAARIAAEAAAANAATSETNAATSASNAATSEASAATSEANALGAAAGVVDYADAAAGLAGTTVGQYFTIPSASADGFVDLYKHDTGPVATFINTLPDAGAVREVLAKLASEFAQTVKAAAGDGTAKLLVTAEGAKTYRSGSTTLIDTLTPLIAPEAGAYFGPGLAEFDAATWGGPSPHPVYPTVSGGALQFYRETGFALRNSGGSIIGLTDFAQNWSRDIVFEMPALAGTYATKADADAAASTHNTGDIVEVTGGTTTTTGGAGWDPVPDPAYKVANLQPNEIIRGYYIKTYTGFTFLNARLINERNTASGSEYSHQKIEPRGQLSHFDFDGATQANVRAVTDLLAMGLTGKVHLHLSRNGDEMICRVNGREYATTHGIAEFVSNEFGFNGQPSASTAQPWQGMTWKVHCLSVTQGCTYREAVDVSNAVARRYGLPTRKLHDTAYLVVNIDQSRTSGTSDASTTPARPDPVSNWNFDLAATANSDNYHKFPTNAPLPDTFCTRVFNRKQVGVFFPSFTIYGNTESGNSYVQATGSIAETIEGGLDAQLRKHMPDPTTPLYIASETYGGAALSLLQQKDADHYLYGLLAGGYTATLSRSKLLQQVAAMAKHARSRGMRLVPIALLNQQGETRAYTASDNLTIGAAHEADFRAVQAEILKLCNSGEQIPVCAKKAISYSSTGADNDYNRYDGTTYYGEDNQYYRVQESRDEDFRYFMVPSIYGYCGRGIHWPFIVQRHLGMIFGDKIGRAYFKNEDVRPLDYTATISGNSVVLTFDKAVELVEFNGPFITGYNHVDGPAGTGWLNYGFVFTGTVSGVSQNANAVFDAGARTLTIPLSGAPAAGDVVASSGTNALFTNIREAADNIGELKTQAWGALPLASSTPTIDFTANAHLEDFAVPKRVTLVASGAAR